MLKRNKRSVHNCPTCGVFVCPNYQLATSSKPEYAELHECDPAFIKRSNSTRDAVMDRDSDDILPRGRCYSERLSEGFEMMNEDEKDDDE